MPIIYTKCKSNTNHTFWLNNFGRINTMFVFYCTILGLCTLANISLLVEYVYNDGLNWLRRLTIVRNRIELWLQLFNVKVI